MFQGKLWNFRNMMRSSVPTKRISRIFDIGDLRSGHFCDLPIISQWAKNRLCYICFGASVFEWNHIVEDSCGQFEKKLHYLPLQRSFEVTRGHQSSFANNFWSKRDRDVGLVSVRSSWPGELTDMQYDPFRSSRDLGLTWPEVKLWPWPFKVILYMVRRALTRQTRWYQIRCSIFKIKDLIVEKPFWKILEFWPLETPILTRAKKWPKWFGNDFSEAFEHCLSFFSTATRSRDHGGGGRSNAPPPSRRWEIQRPSRARVNPRPAGVFSRTRPAGGGGRFCPPVPNSRTNRRSEAGEAAIESPEREDSNAY